MRDKGEAELAVQRRTCLRDGRRHADNATVAKVLTCGRLAARCARCHGVTLTRETRLIWKDRLRVVRMTCHGGDLPKDADEIGGVPVDVCAELPSRT